MQTKHSSEHIVPIHVYLAVFAALLVLLVLTIAVSHVSLGTAANNIVAMLIAVAKAALVVLYFMHVRYSGKLTWLWAGIGFVFVLLMFVITLADYVTRVPVLGWK